MTGPKRANDLSSSQMPQRNSIRPRQFFGLALTVLLLYLAVIVGIASPVAAAPNTEAGKDDLFQSTNLIRIFIQIDQTGIDSLRGTKRSFNPRSRPRAKATVSEGNRLYTNVSVHLKGVSSFQPINASPSLTLSFDKDAPKQRFHGLRKISLNNSYQDSTLLHEKLARELFAAAGVPVPRSDFALVSLNERHLGIYVLTEGYDKEFLKRHFARTDGNFCDGGTLNDIDKPLKVNSGRNPTDHSGLERLLRAAREPDPSQRLHALESALDMDRFLSMVALETLLCHSDSYSLNRNNYRLYHDPSTDKMVFMPHGMDRILGTHRSGLDLSIVPPRLGIVARAVLAIPEGRQRYLDRAGFLFTNLFQPDRLCRRVHEIDAKISEMPPALLYRFERSLSKNHAQDVESLCDRISSRVDYLRIQFAQLREVLLPLPPAELTPGGFARLQEWNIKRKPGQAEPLTFEIAAHDGKLSWHLRTATPPINVSIRSRVALPGGDYRSTGQIKAFDPGSNTPEYSVPTTMLRYSGSRFGVILERLNVAKNLDFQVSEAQAPEEIEFICDLHGNSSEVWFDPSSFHLIRVERGGVSR